MPSLFISFWSNLISSLSRIGLLSSSLSYLPSLFHPLHLALVIKRLKVMTRSSDEAARVPAPVYLEYSLCYSRWQGHIRAQSQGCPKLCPVLLLSLAGLSHPVGHKWKKENIIARGNLTALLCAALTAPLNTEQKGSSTAPRADKSEEGNTVALQSGAGIHFLVI